MGAEPRRVDPLDRLPAGGQDLTHATWHNIRRELDRLHLGTFIGPTGLFRQVTA